MEHQDAALEDAALAELLIKNASLSAVFASASSDNDNIDLAGAQALSGITDEDLQWDVTCSNRKLCVTTTEID